MMETGNSVSRDQKGLRLDGLVFSEETDFAVVAENLVAFGEADEDHLDLQPAKRLYQNLLGTPLADRLSVAIADRLRDSRWRVQEFAALFLDELFFLSGRPQPTATAAHQRMLDIIEQQPSLLAFGPTCTLRSALMYLIEQGETRAIRLARKHRDLAGDHVTDALARRDRG
jgi:hypothetical protein